MVPIVLVSLDDEIDVLQRVVIEDINRSFLKIDRLLGMKHKHGKSLVQSKLIVISYLIRTYKLHDTSALAEACNRYIVRYNETFDGQLQTLTTPTPLFNCFRSRTKCK